jgi:hypothetical protein
MNLRYRTAFASACPLLGPLLGVLLFLPIPAAASVRILESGDRRVRLEIVPGEAEVTPVQAQARTYVSLEIPGMGLTDVAGEPELPMASVRVAVPPGMVPRLRVVSQEWSPAFPGAVTPTPERIGVRDPFGPDQVVEKEPEEGEAYRAQVEFPETPFSLSPVKGLRDLRVVEVRYAGARAGTFTRSYRLLRRAVVEVDFEAAPAGPRGGRRLAERPVRSPELWQRTYGSTVINRTSLDSWSRGGSADGPSVGDAPWGSDTQWRVEVTQTGLYEIPFGILEARGFPAGADVDEVSLYQRQFDLDSVDDAGTPAGDLFQSIPVPSVVRDRNSNGILDASDGILFWGRSVRDQWMTSGWEHEDLFDVRNYVFLRVDPAGGARMAIDPGGVPSAAADSLLSTPSSVRAERDQRYTTYTADCGPGREAYEAEFYFWNDHRTPTGAAGWPMNDSFSVVDLVPGSAGSLLARVCPTGKPIYNLYTNVVTFGVNGTEVGNRRFYNNSFYGTNGVVNPDSSLNRHMIPGGVLGEGANAFDFLGKSYRGNSITNVDPRARFLFDWYEVTWQRQLVARNGGLTLSTESQTGAELRVRVRGFGGSDLLLLDVTDGAAPRWIDVDPAQVVDAGGTWDLRFGSPADAQARRYRAARESDVRVVDSTELRVVAPPTLLAGGVGGKYVAVSADALRSGADELVAYRSDRYSAVSASVSEIYDTFGNGRIDPKAIKAYACYAYHRWTDPIIFLCLIGDASEDHRGVTPESSPDLVPSHSLWAQHEGAPEETDQYYAELTRDGLGQFDELADIYVGRLALNTLEEMSWNFERIRSYENEDLNGIWRRRILFLADDALSGDFGGGVGSGYGWRPSETDFCERSHFYAQQLEQNTADALLPDVLCWSQFSHPCPDSCNTHDASGSGNCPGDCGIWYDCRILPWTVDAWQQEYPCVRDAVKVATLPVLREKLNNGVLVWNYEGHANKYFLGHEEVWRDDTLDRHDVETLRNEGKPFIFLGFACHLAEFDRADELVREDCVAEKLMNVHQFDVDRPAGCVGAFASSGFEFLNPNLVFNEFVLDALFRPESLGDSELPDGAVLPDDGDPNAYVLTLGEATTRARLVYQERYGAGQSENFRQAAQRFVLLGDPALSPDIGTPRLSVAVNATPVEDPTQDFFVSSDEGGELEIMVTAAEGRGISQMRVVDSELGTLDPSAYTVTDDVVTPDGVPQQRTLTYPLTLRTDEIYSVAVEAVDGAGHVSRFRLRTTTTFDFTAGNPAVYPNPFPDRTRVVFQLTKRSDNAQLQVFTVTGRKILERDLGGLDANRQQQVEWDGRDESGLPVANGTYFLRLKLSGDDGSLEQTFPVVKMS